MKRKKDGKRFRTAIFQAVLSLRHHNGHLGRHTVIELDGAREGAERLNFQSQRDLALIDADPKLLGDGRGDLLGRYGAEKPAPLAGTGLDPHAFAL